jgi:anti-anti-sigma regulatory factor
MCNEMKGKFVLCGLMPNVQKLIEIAQLDKVLTIVASDQEARAVIS